MRIATASARRVTACGLRAATFKAARQIEMAQVGEAKRRGTLEQRIAQSVERKRIEDAKLHAHYVREEEKRRARMDALPPQERQKEIRRGYHNRLMLAALGAALALPPIK